MALGYTLAGVLTGGALLLASGIVGVLWLAVSGARPDLMDRDRPPEG
jgi:hypothetical protein